jgi:hypothetical protein
LLLDLLPLPLPLLVPLADVWVAVEAPGINEDRAVGSWA